MTSAALIGCTVWVAGAFGACEMPRSGVPARQAVEAATEGIGDRPPALTSYVNDFAQVIPADAARALESESRALQADTGAVIVVATVRTIRPWTTIAEYANVMFNNHGKGIGDAVKDNGVLMVLAVDDRQVRITTGLGMEPIVTDAFAQQTVDAMIPLLREANYGGGLQRGVSAIASRIRAADSRR
jgi:uncharacterized protein